ncbi:MAG TPA: carboxypeptidase-like regulatory domain-containing protein, partial [Polyangiaceae bacterium]|nr:carboxypeptidase-like regulatory domain-containing protein [Polyangiaceae bacterium]
MMMPVKRALFLFCSAASLAFVVGTGGCGSDNNDGADSGLVTSDDGSGGGFGTQGDGGGLFGTSVDGGAVAPCADGSGLKCYVDASCSTTLSGTVFDPAGRNPLYNVVVFVPNDPNGVLPAITPGTKTCNTCDVSIGNYIAATTTDANGHFSLSGIPGISHLPLVVQTGKWRREVFLPSVTSCIDNPVPAADSRLPKNHKEGDLPQMALLTGGCDDLGCFMKSMGIDDAEYTAPHGGGRLDIYQGQGLGGGGGIFGGGGTG